MTINDQDNEEKNTTIQFNQPEKISDLIWCAKNSENNSENKSIHKTDWNRM